MFESKVYKFRLKPTKTQSQQLYQQAGVKRYVYNWALAERKKYYEDNKKSLNYSKQSNMLTKLKQEPETKWLYEYSSSALQQALRDLDRAYQNFFSKRSSFPRFKSKHDSVQSFREPSQCRVQDGKIKVPKIGWIKLRQSQDVLGKTKSATFKMDAQGHWYVTLVTEFEILDAVLLTTEETTLGIDLGLKDFIVTSEGERVSPPQHYRKAEKKLARLQRSHSRKKKGSQNREKSRKKLAKAHAKVRNQRNDFLHKITTSLVNSHDAIAVEDLNTKGLMKTKLAKSIGDAGWGEFVRQLEYKSRWNCKPFTKIDRFYPSSKTCNVCGVVNSELKLSDREWMCTCGQLVDRDMNAALNIKQQGLLIFVAAGHVDTINACGETVSPPH